MIFSLFSDHPDLGDRVGIAFLLLSCVVQGTQYVYEELVMLSFKEGDQVEARWKEEADLWLPGRITGINEDGTYQIQ